MGTSNKLCINCANKKPLTDEFFQWRSDRQKWRNKCKDCIKAQKQSYNRKNIDSVRLRRREHYLANKKEIIAKRKLYYEANKNKVRDAIKKWESANQSKVQEYQREYYKINKNHINRLNSNAKKKRFANNPPLRVRANISRTVLLALQEQGESKRGKSIFDKLSYSADDLKEHLESQFEQWMSWDNYGSYRLNEWDDEDYATWKWNIDHIIPQSKLPYNSMNHINFTKCWTLNNLRPLCAKENLIKGSRVE